MPQLRRILTVVDAFVTRFEEAVLAGGVLLMAVLNVANVVARNVFSSSFAATEELNQVLIVLVTFLGIGYGARQARHIRMSAVYDQLSGRARKVLMVVVAGGTSLLLFLLAVYAASYVGTLHATGRVTPVLRIPLFWVYLWVPVGFALGGIQYALTVVRNLTSEGIWASYEVPDTYEEGGREVEAAW